MWVANQTRPTLQPLLLLTVGRWQHIQDPHLLSQCPGSKPEHCQHRQAPWLDSTPNTYNPYMSRYIVSHNIQSLHESLHCASPHKVLTWVVTFCLTTCSPYILCLTSYSPYMSRYIVPHHIQSLHESLHCASPHAVLIWFVTLCLTTYSPYMMVPHRI
jgi:hypothetical protein